MPTFYDAESWSNQFIKDTSATTTTTSIASGWYKIAYGSSPHNVKEPVMSAVEDVIAEPLDEII